MVLTSLFGAPPEPTPPPRHEAEFYAAPYGLQLYHAHQAQNPLLRRQLYVGATASGLLYTGPDEHVIAFANPRSDFGKTTFLGATNLIKHPGPAAWLTSKAQGIITATALARSAVAGGPDGVFHMSFDGETFPGLVDARWSLIVHSRGDYELIEDAVRQLASVALGKGDAKQQFWSESAIVYVSVVLTACALMYLEGEDAWR